MKKISILKLMLLLQFFASSTSAAPYVTNVVAKQRFPWNGYVDVKYEIVGETSGIENLCGTLKATDKESGRVCFAHTFVKPLDFSPGEHHAIWNMAADADFVSTNVVFAVSIEKASTYLVVDLSGGKNALRYPVTELDEVPEGGWSEEYKTTKLVLRYIKPGTFKKGRKESRSGQCNVTLTKPYYIGIFEVTQKQYELVMGNEGFFRDIAGGEGLRMFDSFGSVSDVNPAFDLAWNNIRGSTLLSDEDCRWPIVKTVYTNSFVGLLQAKTGMNIDLPTHAQWEYACRAGTTTDYYWGKNLDYGNNNLDCAYVWCYLNADDRFHEVGTRLPNAWGLYDMNGNVMEWCLDWFVDRVFTDSVDPVGPMNGTYRVGCGDSIGDYYWHYGEHCFSSFWEVIEPSRRGNVVGWGFRLARTMSK